MEYLFILLVVGVNLALWTAIGGARLWQERLKRELVRAFGKRPAVAVPTHAGPPAVASALPVQPQQRLSPDDVAVLIPGHNEEAGIGATVDSALRLVRPDQVHMVADGCTDRTAAIARSRGIHVLELTPGRGKAGAIQTALAHYDLPRKFAVLLIADADTELDEHYLARGLPMLDQPEVVALAGYARASWRPRELSLVGRYLISYRTRVYALMQWLRYGQTWQWTNVTAIVPGFASMYKTSVLGAMDLNPPGLVIEDFNMTFEVHHKRLGKVAFRPGVFATTQDPDNLRDYYRQVLRWNLGFWQTVRRHGLWRSWFCAALVLFVAEVLVASIGIILLVAWLLIIGIYTLAGDSVAGLGALSGLVGLGAFLTLTSLFLFLFLPDYLLTCLTALAFRRPAMLLYGLGFLVLRFVDATAALAAIPLAWLTRSTGQWTSPARRPTMVTGDADADPAQAASAAETARPDEPRERG